MARNISKMLLLTHCIIVVMQLSSSSSEASLLFADAFVSPSSSSSKTSMIAISGSTRIQREVRQAQHITLKSSSSSEDADNESDETLFMAMNTTTDGKSEPAALFAMDSGAASASSTASGAAQFGDVVRLGSGSQQGSDDAAFFAPAVPLSAKPTVSAAEEKAKTRKKQNLVVAVASIGLAIMNYLYEFTHPLSTLQLLSTMQQDHAPQNTLHLLGNNGKPTMVDFWAPWCENCKQLAPTLYQVQQQYGRDVNFVMVNGDDPAAWPLIEAFGVDAIPHMALVEADGTVDTALIGPVPKAWLDADLQVLIENSRQMSSSSKEGLVEGSVEPTTTTKATLPYQMLDVFANRPEARRLQISLKE